MLFFIAVDMRQSPGNVPAVLNIMFWYCIVITVKLHRNVM